MRFALGLLLALGISACAKEPPEIVTVVTEPPNIPPPPECLSKDPKWKPMPDRALRKSDPPRAWADNRRLYQDLVGKRDVCRAGLLAQGRGP